MQFIKYRMQTFSLAMLLIGLVLTNCDSPNQPQIVFEEDRLFSDHKEIDVRYRSEDGTNLAGTIFLPLSDGPHPAVVLQSGSGPWTRPPYTERSGLPGWIRNGVAVLGYDKRGAGESGGECCNWRETGYYYRLADDVCAGVKMLRERPDINPDRIGLFGASEGGWVVPIVAAREQIAFTMIFSGPAVTLRDELLYSFHTGDDHGCQPTGLTEEEIWAMLASGQLSDDVISFLDGDGFDPIPFLEAMDAPGLWLYGGNDTSVPVQRSLDNLEHIKTEYGRDWTFVVFPDANHSLIKGGQMCQTEGPVVDLSLSFDWLVPRLAPADQ